MAEQMTPGPWFAGETVEQDGTRWWGVFGPDAVDPEGLHWQTVVARVSSEVDAEAIAHLPEILGELACPSTGVTRSQVEAALQKAWPDPSGPVPFDWPADFARALGLVVLDDGQSDG